MKKHLLTLAVVMTAAAPAFAGDGPAPVFFGGDIGDIVRQVVINTITQIIGLL